jgi:hypothetical protein
MWIKVRLPLVGSGYFICNAARMVCEKYNELNVSSFGRPSIGANPFGDQGSVNNTISELTILFSLPGRASSPRGHIFP